MRNFPICFLKDIFFDQRSARPSVRKYSSRDTVSVWLPVVTSIDVVGIDLSGIHPVKSLGSLV